MASITRLPVVLRMISLPLADVATAGPISSVVDSLESVLCAVFCVVSGADVSTAGNRVMDAIQLGRTQITGNQELPTVMYIVPWKKADPGDLMGRPVNTLLDEVLAPIDREEFVRQVDYYDDLYSNKQE